MSAWQNQGNGCRISANNWHGSCQILHKRSWSIHQSASLWKETEPVCAASIEQQESACIQTIHQQSGHPDMKCTLYFIKQVSREVSKATVWAVFRDCKVCQHTNLAPVHWEIRNLGVHDNWSRMGTNINHYGGQHYLIQTDCSSCRFSIWWPLLCQHSGSNIQQLKSAREGHLLNYLSTMV